MPFSRAGFHPAQRQAQQSPDVLSLLVETGFISNVRDSQRWVTARHQQALADGLFEGLQRNFQKNPPAHSYIAWRQAQKTSQAWLASSNSAAGEPGTATAGAGKPVDRGPADAPVIADPGFAVRGDAGEKRQLAITTVGLCPVAFTGRFEPAQINRAADSVDAVGIAIGVHASQQIGAAGAGGQRRNLPPGIDGDQQCSAHQRQFQGIRHGVSLGWKGLWHSAFCHRGQKGSGSTDRLYYNI